MEHKFFESVDFDDLLAKKVRELIFDYNNITIILLRCDARDWSEH